MSLNALPKEVIYLNDAVEPGGSHKMEALQRIVDRYGAYICHLVALADDMSIKSVERAKLGGYLQKWKRLKMLISLQCMLKH